MAKAAKNAETAEQQRGEIAELKAQGERPHRLQAAARGHAQREGSARSFPTTTIWSLTNASAGYNARAFSLKTCQRACLLNARSVDKLKEAEPWLFESTGKTLRHWREIAGLTDDDGTKKS